jgi:hypothetical protein
MKEFQLAKRTGKTSQLTEARKKQLKPFLHSSLSTKNYPVVSQGYANKINWLSEAG